MPLNSLHLIIKSRRSTAKISVIAASPTEVDACLARLHIQNRRTPVKVSGGKMPNRGTEGVPVNPRVQAACGGPASAPYMAPFRLITALTVLNSIFTSSARLQLQMYCVSSFTISSKFVISLRPLTCHMPVMPGFIASRIR